MTEDQPSDRRLEEAMDWLLRVRDRPDDPDLRDRLEAWLAADPARLSAWNQARKAWQSIGDLPPTTAGDWEQRSPLVEADRPLPTTPAVARPKRSDRKPRRGRIVLAAAALAAAACLALAVAPTLALRLQADHVTTTAELREVTLEDGSVVQLAPESAIDLRFSADRRTVALLAGDAFFDVVPDARRPFVVEAGELEARAIGTAFGVAVSAGWVDVEVDNGSVGVRSEATRPPTDRRLDRGETLRLDRASGTVRLGRKAPGDIAAWRQGQLLAVDASIAEVVEKLRGYHAGWIVIADDRLAAKRVNGVYDLRNPDKALRALVHPVGGRLHEITPLLRVLR